MSPVGVVVVYRWEIGDNFAFWVMKGVFSRMVIRDGHNCTRSRRWLVLTDIVVEDAAVDFIDFSLSDLFASVPKPRPKLYRIDDDFPSVQ